MHKTHDSRVYTVMEVVLTILMVMAVVTTSTVLVSAGTSGAATVSCQTGGRALPARRIVQTVRVPITLKKTRAQAGYASAQSVFQAVQKSASYDFAESGFRHRGGGVTTSFIAPFSTGLAVVTDGQPWARHMKLALQENHDNSGEQALAEPNAAAQEKPEQTGGQASALADGEVRSGDSTIIFLCALLVLICTQGLYVMVNVQRGRRDRPHEKKQF